MIDLGLFCQAYAHLPDISWLILENNQLHDIFVQNSSQKQTKRNKRLFA